MSSNIKTAILAGSVATLAAAALPAQAYEAGDVLIRAGVASIIPNDDSNNVEGIDGSGVSVDESVGFGISFSYMLTPKVGVELLGAAPFTHDIKGTGSISALGKVGETKHLPPTLLVNYYLPVAEGSRFAPYAGIGINYTLFFEEDASDSLEEALGGPTDIDLDDSAGAAVQLGTDWTLSDHWMLNAAAWWVDIDTTATLTTGDTTRTVDVKIDPWVLMAGIAYRF